LKLEFKRIQIYPPSVVIMQHVPRAEDSRLHIVPYRQKGTFTCRRKSTFLPQISVSSLLITKMITKRNLQKRHWPPFSFKYITQSIGS